jgi:hypothetical protein
MLRSRDTQTRSEDVVDFFGKMAKADYRLTNDLGLMQTGIAGRLPVLTTISACS